MKLSDVSDRAKDDIAAKTLAEPPAAPPKAIIALPVRAGDARVPDLSALPLREAVKVLVSLGLSPVVEGSGRVARQDPPAGTVLPKGSTIKLVFEPST